jgi:hypothetical protein
MSKDKKEIKVYSFGEKPIEKVKEADGRKELFLKVWQSPKFTQSKEKAIQLIESDYGLDTGDFWILMNKGGGGMTYSGLIISHNGCLKINDKLEEKMRFKPSAVSFLKDNGGDKVMQYVCDEQGIYEFGEIAPANCKNQYPYAMVLKRLMDRVILKASKIGYFGIYSENESDDFKNKNEEPEEKPKNQFSGLAEVADKDMKATQREANENAAKIIEGYLNKAKSKQDILDIVEYNKQQINKLSKYAPDLFKPLKALKDSLINSFDETKTMDEAGNYNYMGE